MGSRLLPDGMTVAHWGYLKAWLAVKQAGYGSDLEWAQQLLTRAKHAGDTYVMSETAWVICNSGFRAQVVRKFWPAFTEAFLQWWPPSIAACAESCREEALRVFGHRQKVDAIIAVAGVIEREGGDQLIKDAADPPKLQRLPFIGPITCYHLAKVLGADVVKPDVHLVRAAKAAGHETPLSLCRDIAAQNGDAVTVIDSVLWRYGEQQKQRGWPTWEVLFSDAEWSELLEDPHA